MINTINDCFDLLDEANGEHISKGFAQELIMAGYKAGKIKAIEQKQKPLSEEQILSILRNELGIQMKDCGIFKAFCMYVERAHGIG